MVRVFRAPICSPFFVEKLANSNDHESLTGGKVDENGAIWYYKVGVDRQGPLSKAQIKEAFTVSTWSPRFLLFLVMLLLALSIFVIDVMVFRNLN